MTEPTEINEKMQPAENAEPTEPIEQADPLQEMKELVQRTQANFENYRKQTEKRIEDIRETAAKGIILQLLPILDNFELAFKSHAGEKNELLHGIELIYAQLFSVLEEQGVAVINTGKQKFDPYYHEALLKVESDLPENTILEEFQKGYTLKGQVIRHAKVKISAGPKKENQTEKKNQIQSEEIKNGK